MVFLNKFLVYEVRFWKNALNLNSYVMKINGFYFGLNESDTLECCDWRGEAVEIREESKGLELKKNEFNTFGINRLKKKRLALLE